MTPRILWLAAAAVLFGLGVGVVWWPSAQDIAQMQAQAKNLYDGANANERVLRQAARMRAARARVAADVRALAGSETPNAATVRAIRLLDRRAKAFGLEIRAVVPALPPSPAPAASAQAGSLLGFPVEIDLRGTFRAVLAFTADIPRHDVLVEVRNLDLAAAGDRARKPVLDARLAVTVYRYLGTEVHDAAGAL